MSSGGSLPGDKAPISRAILRYLTTRIDIQSDRSRSPLMQYVLSWDPHISVQCIAVIINFPLTIFKDDGNTYLRLADTYHV
jgi:hypothetical protein